jgi:hypothetical protein
MRGHRWKSPERISSIDNKGSTKVVLVLSEKKAEYFKRLLESRISELNRMLAAAEQETRASATRHADPADQAAAEYERQEMDVLDKSLAQIAYEEYFDAFVPGAPQVPFAELPELVQAACGDCSLGDEHFESRGKTASGSLMKTSRLARLVFEIGQLHGRLGRP